MLLQRQPQRQVLDQRSETERRRVAHRPGAGADQATRFTDVERVGPRVSKLDVQPLVDDLLEGRYRDGEVARPDVDRTIVDRLDGHPATEAVPAVADDDRTPGVGKRTSARDARDPTSDNEELLAHPAASAAAAAGLESTKNCWQRSASGVSPIAAAAAPSA